MNYDGDSDNDGEHAGPLEQPNQGGLHHPVHFDPGDPDDPDNPGDPVNPNDGVGIPHIDENIPNFNLDSPQLNGLCRIFRHCTKREALALMLAVAVRDHSTYENVIHFMTVLNTILGRDIFPTNELMLWQLIGRTPMGITKYAYCRSCGRDLGLLDALPEFTDCDCEQRFHKSKAGVYVDLDLGRQLKNFLTNPRLRNLLVQFRPTRQKMNPNNVEDIMDGEGYMQLRQPGGVLDNDYHFSFTLNADALKVAKKATTSATPIFIRLNELPFTVRQKHMFLAGLWIDDKKPDMNVFMGRFVEQANNLARNGITWQREDGVVITSKFFVTCCVVDAMGRCDILNCNPPTGHFACTFCTHAGVYINGIKYPLLPPIPYRLPVRRTHEDIIECMLQAPQRGFKGVASIMNLDHFNLANGFSTDDLHPIFLGVTKFHLSLLLKSEGQPYYIGLPATRRRIDKRMLPIRTPSFISRKPRSISRYKSWTGTEARNFLLYFMVPCLRRILRREYLTHFALLSQAVFLISRETISPQDLDEAERCINRYVIGFQQYFHPVKMRFNVHILTHVVEMIRRWGPPYVQTTCNFESWNRHIVDKVTSPKGSTDQVVNRFFMSSFVNSALDHPEISDRVKEKIHELLNGREPRGVYVGNVKLVGRRSVRPPTAEEQQLLQQHGLNCQRVSVYRRARYDGVEFRPHHYTYNGGLTRSDDSYIYTWNDAFGVIENILLVRQDNGVRNVFLTVSVLHTLEPINPSITYSVRIDNDFENPVVLMTFGQIRGHAIRVNTPGRFSCVMPVTNRYEID